MAAPNLAEESGPHPKGQLRCTIAQNVRQESAKIFFEKMQHAVENAISDPFNSGTPEIYEKTKNAPGRRI